MKLVVTLLVVMIIATGASVGYAWSTLSGAITICKFILDQNGNVVDGSALTGTSFTISGVNAPHGYSAVGKLPNTDFKLPLTLNKDLLFSDGKLDSQCITYKNLAIGAYFYGQEIINDNNSIWNNPRYNDQHTLPVMNLNDLFPYSNQLFTPDPSDDGARNTNSDGHIILNKDRQDRTLVVMNQYTSVPGTVISNADVSFYLESQIRDPDGKSNTRDEYFANMITACILRSGESISKPVTITCQLTDDRNGKDKFGAVIAEGSLPLPAGYQANTKISIPITTTTFNDANEIQNVHDVKIIVMGPAPPAQPPEGCSPGFWKNHPNAWSQTGFKTGDKFFDVFGRTITIKVDNKNVNNPTLLQALKAQGGGINALARQSVAALLNAAHPTVDPEPAFDTPQEVISAFQTAFDSGSYNPTKDLLDTSNHRGSEICGKSDSHTEDD